MSVHQHPANGMTATVDVGDGAIHTIINPQSFEDGGLEWCLRYSKDIEPFRYVAAGLIESFDYLISDQITMKEATRRLRLLRSARKQLQDKTL